MVFDDLIKQVETFDIKKVKLIMSNIERIKNQKIKSGMTTEQLNELYEKCEKIIQKSKTKK